MPRRRIGPLFAVFVAFVVLMASNAWLKSIFGYGEIATDIPFLLAGAVLFLAWRFNRRAANQRNDLLGSARFGDRADVRKLEANGDLLIGRSAKSGKLLHYDGAAHLLTMAPTCSSMGIGTTIFNLLLLDRSVICIDPKGENARVTARARAAKGNVWCLDPFVRSAPARYNPLDLLDPASLDLAEDANTLADALVHDASGQSGEAHWNEEAKTLTARASNRQLGKSDREAAGVLSSAQRHTHFLDSPRIVASTAASDFTFAGLKDTTVTVFLCLPPDWLDTYACWLRLLVS